MSRLAAGDEVSNLEFKWGKKRGVGGKKKEVQFYESFTYDGVDYTLHDCVCLYKEGEPEPYIGKIIKIWENPDKTKKIKVLWFFRPCEILNFLGDEETPKNELFLASSEGVDHKGLANVNPLEALAGKCNVVCISKDDRNPQPSEGEIQRADFVFYRTFDVGRQSILDNIDDKIAGVEAKFIFNRTECQKSSGVPKLDSTRKEDSGIAVPCNETPILSKHNPFEEHKTVKMDRNDGDTSAKQDAAVNASLIEQKSSPREIPATDANVKLGEMATTTVKQGSVLEGKTTPRSKVNSDKGDDKVGMVKSLKDSGELDNRPSKKAKVDDSATLSKDKNRNTVQKLSIDSDGNDVKALPVVTATEDKTKSKLAKDSLGRNTVQKQSIDSDGKEVKTLPVVTAAEDKTKPKLARDSLGRNTVQKLSINSDGKDVKALPVVTAAEDKMKSKLDSLGRNTVQKLSIDSVGKHVKALPIVTPAEDKMKSKLPKDSLGLDKGLSKKLKPDEKISMHSNGKLHKASPRQSLDEDSKTNSQVMEVTRRPDADSSKWFTGLPWEDRMLTAHKQGTLVLLENLDPAYTSAEVEDIVWHGFKESCTAKMLQRTVITSLHSGQAFVIFKTRERAEKVVKKLDEGCLMLSNGRPLVGSIAAPCLSGKESSFVGHLYIDKIKLVMQREMKQAVSTSHCSQPNTIEYEMAMEWCLLQERSDTWWKKLYKQQGEELRKVKAELKSK